VTDTLGSFRQNAPAAPFVPSPLAGEGTMVCPRTRMGEGLLRQATPHPSSRVAASSSLSRKGRGRCNTHRACGPHARSSYLVTPLSPFQTAHLVPAPALLRPGFASLLRSPQSRGGRSAERRSGARRNTRWTRHDASKTRVNALMTRRARRLARRLASHDAGRSPLGAPP
jgi:hypothetical protein